MKPAKIDICNQPFNNITLISYHDDRGISVSISICIPLEVMVLYSRRNFAPRRPRPAMSGISMKSLLSSAGRNAGYGAPLIKMGYVLDEIVQTRRNTKAAKRLLVWLLKKQGYAPKRIVINRLQSYGATRRRAIPHIDHSSHKGLKNRAENSHLPFRKRERYRQAFRLIGSLQDFISVLSATRNHFVHFGISRSAGLSREHRINAIAESNVTVH